MRAGERETVSRSKFIAACGQPEFLHEVRRKLGPQLQRSGIKPPSYSKPSPGIEPTPPLKRAGGAELRSHMMWPEEGFAPAAFDDTPPESTPSRTETGWHRAVPGSSPSTLPPPAHLL